MDPEYLLLCSHTSSSVPNLSQINPMHTFPSYALKIRFNIIFLCTPSLSSGLFLVPPPHKNILCTYSLSHAYYMSRPLQPPSLTILNYEAPHYAIFFKFLGPNFLLSTLFL
jgi:hypothetical protein